MNMSELQCSRFNGCLRTSESDSESFDGAQNERNRFEMIQQHPFMLSASKHVQLFCNSLLTFNLLTFRREYSELERMSMHAFLTLKCA